MCGQEEKVKRQIFVIIVIIDVIIIVKYEKEEKKHADLEKGNKNIFPIMWNPTACSHSRLGCH